MCRHSYKRLNRVFHIDIEYCGVCGDRLRVIACIETPEVIERILTHLTPCETGGINHSRAPPLHMAAECRWPDVAETLLAATVRDLAGSSP